MYCERNECLKKLSLEGNNFLKFYVSLFVNEITVVVVQLTFIFIMKFTPEQSEFKKIHMYNVGKFWILYDSGITMKLCTM